MNRADRPYRGPTIPPGVTETMRDALERMRRRRGAGPHGFGGTEVNATTGRALERRGLAYRLSIDPKLWTLTDRGYRVARRLWLEER